MTNEQKIGSKMRRNKFIKTVAGVILVAVMTIFTSCEKDNVQPLGRVVFEVEGKSYTVDNIKADINSQTLSQISPMFNYPTYEEIGAGILWINYFYENEPVNVTVKYHSSDLNINIISSQLYKYLGEILKEDGEKAGFGVPEIERLFVLTYEYTRPTPLRRR